MINTSRGLGGRENDGTSEHGSCATLVTWRDFKVAMYQFLCHIFTTKVFFVHLFSLTKIKVKEDSAENLTGLSLWLV